MKNVRRPTALNPITERKKELRRNVGMVLQDARARLLAGEHHTDKVSYGRPKAPKPAPRSSKRRGRAGVLHRLLPAAILLVLSFLIGLPALLTTQGYPKEAAAVAVALITALTKLTMAARARRHT